MQNLESYKIRFLKQHEYLKPCDNNDNALIPRNFYMLLLKMHFLLSAENKIGREQ